jgi:Transposase DNA-binding/Transposase DDE domain
MPNEIVRERQRQAVADEEPTDDWVERELAGCQFKDERLGKRFRTLLGQLAEGTGESIPMACQDWANTKAAYRFLSNERVNEHEILAGHFEATHARFLAAAGTVLVLHDTTELCFRREDGRDIGYLTTSTARSISRPQSHKVCGMLMHSSLAVTTEGLPLGVAAIKFWTRDKFKGTNKLKKHINPTRVPIEEKESIRWLRNLEQSTELLGEPQRCVHIGDREADIFELFWTAQRAGTHFLFRTCVDRCAEDGSYLVEDLMQEAPCKGLHRVDVRDKKGNMRQAILELRYRRIKILPSRAKQNKYQPLTMTVLYAEEKHAPRRCEAIRWKLVTDLPVRSRAEALEKLEWYALRWQIETFHKIMKSGCEAEDSKLRTAERLVNLMATFCIMSWRIFWMTMLNRSAEAMPQRFALTPLEIELLDRLLIDKKISSKQRRLSDYLTRIAQLGGYLARANDPPPGNTVIWRGLARLTDIELGFTLADDICG